MLLASAFVRRGIQDKLLSGATRENQHHAREEICGSYGGKDKDEEAKRNPGQHGTPRISRLTTQTLAFPEK